MSKPNIPESIKRAVKIRAAFRCEYCCLNQIGALIEFHIDHIIPEKQDGSSDLDNLCFACASCNRFKGASIAAYDHKEKVAVLLYNPRAQMWDKNFRLLPNGKIEPLTSEGKATIRILKLNMLNRIQRRKSQIETGLL